MSPTSPGDQQQMDSLRKQIDANNGLIRAYEREMNEAVSRGSQEHPTQIQSCQNTIRALRTENDRLQGYINDIAKK